MSMQFLCSMAFTAIAAGAVQMVAAPDPSCRETATQRRRRQREASVQHRFQVYEDRLSSIRNDRPYYDDRRKDRPYYNDRRNADYSLSGRGGPGGGRPRSPSRQNDRGHRPHSPANTNDRSQVQPRNAAWGLSPPSTRNGGWDMPIIVEDANALEDATSAASPEAGAVPAPSQIAEVDAVPTPEEVAQVVAPPTILSLRCSKEETRS
ncbi:hypothetical protein DYB37_011681 [Aphanomyces astaci]|uniref:Btz domain-containing protein n=1 Tax=Aphanomyces astaci TaxID=112090 RepID=A0A418FI54_APHAT|nr:hypothetical protein DYB37_011681 [Aphanomyces astaci]